MKYAHLNKPRWFFSFLSISFLHLTCLIVPSLANSQTVIAMSKVEPEAKTDKTKSSTVERCEEKLLKVKIRNHVFVVPRNFTSIRLSNNETLHNLDRPQLLLPCKQDEITVTAVSTHELDIQDIDLTDRERIMGKYKFAKKRISDAQENKEIQVLPNGTSFFTFKETDYYILPISKAPTYDGSPIVLECTKNSIGTYEAPYTNTCSTLFTEPSGFLISYRFFRKDYKPEQYLSLHQKKMNVFQTLQRE